jgi:hypothetical protein
MWWSLASASVVRMTALADANGTRMTNTFCVYTVLRYSLLWTVGVSETCKILQINLRNSASYWLSLQEYTTMHGPMNVKFIYPVLEVWPYVYVLGLRQYNTSIHRTYFLDTRAYGFCLSASLSGVHTFRVHVFIFWSYNIFVNLTSMWPCIVIYSYNKTNEVH